MASMNRIIIGSSHDPWRNLALEELIFDSPGDGVSLYLWQNENTVVIGKNQNAWRECRTSLMEDEGCTLARRTSGGGAVYHDLGNLNFSFVSKKALYDDRRSTDIIIAAVRSLGVQAHFTGRNDIVTGDGAKFSGNAFRFSREAALRHGTLLVAVDMDRLSRYLAPSRAKLESKGVESVRARVANLAEKNPAITPETLAGAVAAAFEREYGKCVRADESFFNEADVAKIYERNASWEWRMGSSPRFDAELEKRFPWGSVELGLTLSSGLVTAVRCYSDAMDVSLAPAVASALEGARFGAKDLSMAVGRLESAEACDVSDWLKTLEL